MERTRPIAPWFARATLWLTLSALALPLVVLIISSLLDQESGAIAPTLRWYHEVFEDPLLWAATARSLTVAIGVALISTTIGTLAAIAGQGSMAGTRSFSSRALRKGLSGLSALSMSLPELVLGLSLLCWFVLLGLPLGFTTVTIAHVTLTLPFATLAIGVRLQALDESLREAARDLGANEGAVFRRVTLPLLRPALLSTFLLCFLLSFDDFLVTFFTGGAGSDTLPVTLYARMKTGLSPKLHALSTLTLAVSAVLAMLLLRWLAPGAGSARTRAQGS